MAENKLLTVEEIMKILNISKSTCYKLLKDPDFPSFKLGRNYRVREDELMNWIDEQAKASEEEKIISETSSINEKAELVDYDRSTYITLIEAAKILHISERKMSKLYKVDGFPYIKQGNLILIPIKEFNEWTNNMVGKSVNID